MNSDRPNLPVEHMGMPGWEGSAQGLVARRYRFGCWLVIEADGEVDIDGVPLLNSLLDSDSTHMVFDLHRVTFIDAGGLGLLAGTHRRVSRAHGAVRVARPSPRTRKVLTLTALDQHIVAYESLGQAFTGHASCW